MLSIEWTTSQTNMVKKRKNRVDPRGIRNKCILLRQNPIAPPAPWNPPTVESAKDVDAAAEKRIESKIRPRLCSSMSEKEASVLQHDTLVLLLSTCASSLWRF